MIGALWTVLSNVKANGQNSTLCTYRSMISFPDDFGFIKKKMQPQRLWWKAEDASGRREGLFNAFPLNRYPAKNAIPKLLLPEMWKRYLYIFPSREEDSLEAVTFTV